MHTKEVLYEKYRTEKLLARRATSHITEKEQIRLFEGKSSLCSPHPRILTVGTIELGL